MNFLFLIALVGILVIVLLPFFILGNQTSLIHHGIAHEVLKPGFRRYTIIVPSDYTGEESVPLVLALHYSGHGIAYYGEFILTNLIEPALGELGAVLIAPDCPAKDWIQPESEQFVFDLLAEVQKRFNIDPKRILIMGYSMGGTGTWHYAGRFPEHFTAAIVMAGRPPEDVLEIDWQVPLMVIHGRKDEVVPLQETKEAVLLLERKGVDVDFRILEGVTHYETHYFVGALRNAMTWLSEKWKTITV